MVFYIRKEKIEMHKQFDQVVALCIGKNFCASNLYMCMYNVHVHWCSTLRKMIGMQQQFDQWASAVNLRSVWHLRNLFCPATAHSLSTVTILKMRRRRKRHQLQWRFTVVTMMMMMIIRMTPQQTKTVDPGGIQRPRTRCGTQTSSFAPGPSPLPSHLLNQPLHVSLFLFLQLDYNI